MHMKNRTIISPRKIAIASTLAIFMAASACALNPFYKQGPPDNMEKPAPTTAAVTKSPRPADRTRCGLTPDRGRCRAAFPRYFFDTRSGKCQQFIWGGCGGTVPFKSLKECKADCEF